MKILVDGSTEFIEHHVINWLVESRTFDEIIGKRHIKNVNFSRTMKIGSIELSAENMKLFVIPEGFSHGFQSLEDDCEIMYLVTEFYAPETEDGLIYSDSKLQINWPLPVADISTKDDKHPLLSNEFTGINPSQYGNNI